VTLIGGAQVRSSEITTALSRAPRLVAIDGGANGLLGTRWRPEAVIGDMDSISPEARAEYADCLHPIDEQEFTDFDKALREVAAPLVVALGVLGGRIDHDLAALNVLVRRADRRCLALGGETLVFHCPVGGDLRLGVAAGTPVSLFPLARARAESEGLRWPTKELVFEPAGRIGTSNEALGPVRLRALDAGLLVILPASCFDLAVEALCA